MAGFEPYRRLDVEDVEEVHIREQAEERERVTILLMLYYNNIIHYFIKIS